MAECKSETKLTNYVFTDDDIMEIKFSADYIISECNKDGRNVLKWLASLGLIKNQRKCVYGHQMRLIKNKSLNIGYRWECKKPCRKTISVFSSSIFKDSSLTYKKIMVMLYYWTVDVTQNIIIRESNVSLNVVSDWCEFFRDVIATHMISFNNIIGGLDDQLNPIEVEIDECQFYKRKNSRGRIGNPIWVFGAIERHTRKCFLVPVEDRRRETLMEIIYERIEPGSKIISDMWPSYRSLYNSYQYRHAEVNHNLNFVDPEDPTVHTQNVESMWCHARKKLRSQHGTSTRLFEGYMNKFAFRYFYSNRKDQITNIFIISLKNLSN